MLMCCPFLFPLPDRSGLDGGAGGGHRCGGAVRCGRRTHCEQHHCTATRHVTLLPEIRNRYSTRSLALLMLMGVHQSMIVVLARVRVRVFDSAISFDMEVDLIRRSDIDTTASETLPITSS